MRILHLSAVKNWGGGEHQVQNLYHELKILAPQSHNFILCIKGSEFDAILKKGEYNIVNAPLAFQFDLRYVFQIITTCKKNKIDLLHIHDPTALTLAVMATKLAKLPPFIFSKKTSFEIKSRKRTLYKYNHPQIAKVLCVSDKTRKVASEKIKDISKLTTIYHGTSENKSAETPFKLREKLNIPKGRMIIGTIANHIRAKNLETWISVIDHIINKLGRKDFYFVEMGSFTRRTPAYKKAIKEKGLEKHVSFLGFVENASNFIPQFDISLLTSQSEGLPQFIYESFYHKVPVVSTNVGGIPEIIQDGENAYLTNPFQAESLANKLIALSSDKELQKKFTEISAKKLQKNFTTRIMAEKTLSEYKKVLYGKS